MTVHTPEPPQCNRDSRLLVLLVLGAGILAAGFYPARPDVQPFEFYQIRTGEQENRVLALSRSAEVAPARSGLKKISSDLSCADTPLKLARFFNLPLAINRAGADDLTLLPRIGKGLAEKIITFRIGQGSINGPAALLRINGIGEKTVKRLEPLICFD